MHKQIFYLNRFYLFKSHYILIHIITIVIKPAPSGWRNPIHRIFVLIIVTSCPVSEDPMSSSRSGFICVACASVKIPVIKKNKETLLISSYTAGGAEAAIAEQNHWNVIPLHS